MDGCRGAVGLEIVDPLGRSRVVARGERDRVPGDLADDLVDEVGDVGVLDADDLEVSRLVDDEPGLLADLSHGGRFGSLALLDATAGERPRPGRRRSTALHEEHGAVVAEDDRAGDLDLDRLRAQRAEDYRGGMRFVAENVQPVLAEIAARHGLPTAPGVVAKALAELSRDYNATGVTRTRPEILAARLLFSVVRDVPKMAWAARELVATGLLRVVPGAPLRVLDLGAGLGASTLGLALALTRAAASGVVDACLVDADAAALAVARDVVREWPLQGLSVAPRIVARSVRGAAPEGRFDVILLGQVLSELDLGVEATARAERHASWIEELLDGSLADDGTLLVVEPALRERTRHLHRVRDRLRGRVFSPCLHREACPMLHTEDDWCHEDRAVDLPRFAEPLARAAGLRWQGLTFSYLALRRDGANLAARLGGENLHRLVASPRITKGKRELLLCDGPTLTRAVRLDRDAVKGDAIARAARGDVLRIAIPAAAEQAPSRVERCTEAQCEAAELPVDALAPEP